MDSRRTRGFFVGDPNDGVSLSITRIRGMSLVELLSALAVGSLLLAGMVAMLGPSMATQAQVAAQNQLSREARFAMDRMVSAASRSRQLLLPLADNPNTNWPENVREQTVPPSPPIGDSTLATAVFALALPADVDLDGDGVPDADDDGDGLVDEDASGDRDHDFAPGIVHIDDDGDGDIDEGGDASDDDEDGQVDEDPATYGDADGDGSVGEDAAADINGDGCSGVCGVDDDGDNSVDGADASDDDEDGSSDDDPVDPLVFYLSADALIERTPVPWNEDGISVPDGPVDGRDYVESTLTGNVSLFRVERLPGAASGARVVRLTLELTNPDGLVVSLQTTTRVGRAL